MNEYLTADEARKISRKNLKGPVIKPFLDQILASVRDNAQLGRTVLTHPYSGMNPFPNPPQKDAIEAELAVLGFKVCHHPDPDPGHPASGPYTTVSWE